MTSPSQHRPVVVVTGASAGVGRAVVRHFAKQGAKVGLLARGVEGLEAARAEVEQAGSEALVLPTDVADSAAVEAAAVVVEEQLGPIDIWINNAMVSVFSPAKEMTAEDYRRVTEVTYLGYVYGTLAALHRMLPHDRGMIVQVGSALSYRGIPLQSAYCAAKHAIEGFSESVRTELIHDRSQVRLTLVHLPAINTPQHSWSKSRMPQKAQPVPPIFQPELAAEAIYHAAYHYRREWTLGMITDLVLVGNAVAPGVGDWYMARTGYESQMTDEPEVADRPHNLWDPLPGDYGAHGRFSAKARGWSVQWWLTRHRWAVLLAAALLVGLGILAWKMID
ncbi:SDR family oxidoreductase [Anatilimnocola sp. NA78]|uniref:SDR family oxidoreductase n=1 Tax=Anatilimnocola sp. NA78 TaxID=3415683 RepID=UPI003CE50788